VYDLAPGTEILLTTTGSLPGTRYVLSAGATELTVLNVTDRTIQKEARVALVQMVRRHPEYFGTTQPGATHRNGRLRLGPDGVFLDIGDARSLKVAALEDIVQPVARESVVEIREVHHGAAGEGMVWGALGGLVAGVAMAVAQCGTNWSREEGSCNNMSAAGVGLFPILGLGVGGLAGAGGRGSTLVYAARPPAGAPATEGGDRPTSLAPYRTDAGRSGS
jgi:hypothetical protein